MFSGLRSGRMPAKHARTGRARRGLLHMPNMDTMVAPTAAEAVWIVRLQDHPQYDFVRLKRVFNDFGSRHQVMLVDVQRLLECADRDDTDYVLKAVDDWHAGKVRGIREFLDPDNPRVPEMPYVTISVRRSPGLLGLLGVNREGVVAFRNGQHRARYLAHAGALCLPVEVHEREAQLLREMCAAPDANAPEYGEED